MRQVFLVTIALMGAAHSPLAGRQELPDAHTIWERVIAAKGGRARLHGVRTLVIRSADLATEGDARYRRVVSTVQYELVRAFPDRYWAWEDYRPGTMGFRVEVFNAKLRLDWESRNGGPSVAIPWSTTSEAGRLDVLARDQAVYLLETAFVVPTITQVSRQRGSITLEGTAPGVERLRYVIDAATYLPRSVTLTPHPVPLPDRPGLHAVPATTYALDAYVAVDGLQLPSRVAGLGDVEFLVNPDIDPKLFETPPNRVTARDAWKTFLRK